MFELTRLQLRALLRFASTDEFHDRLYAVCFDGDSGNVTASDGHVLLRYSSGQSIPGQGKCLVDAGVLRRVSSVMGRTESLKLDMTSETVSLSVVGAGVELSVRMPRPDTEPHDYEAIISEVLAEHPERVPRIGVNPRLLGRLARVCQAVGDDTVVLTMPKDRLSPIRAHWPHSPRWTAAVMPRRPPEEVA